MTKNQLEALVRKARGFAPEEILSPDEPWDSLDHLSIIAALSQVDGMLSPDTDISEATTLNRLAAILCK